MLNDINLCDFTFLNLKPMKYIFYKLVFFLKRKYNHIEDYRSWVQMLTLVIFEQIFKWLCAVFSTCLGGIDTIEWRIYFCLKTQARTSKTLPGNGFKTQRSVWLRTLLVLFEQNPVTYWLCKVASKCLKLDGADEKKVSSENKQYFKCCAATTSGHIQIARVWCLTFYVNRTIDFKSNWD